MRSGKDYIASLDDGRDVWLDGQRVPSVAKHPAFTGIVTTIAACYDRAGEPGSVLADPETGDLAFYTIPRTREQAAARKAALEEWSRLTHGFIGRGPDHVSGLLAGFASHPALFDEGRPGGGDAVVSCHHRSAERGLWITNSIVPPQSNPSDPTSTVRPVQLVKETDAGIVVAGAQMLGTGAAVADEIFVTSVRPLRDGEQARAVSFVIPIASRGLRLICRRPYATAGGEFDYPLSNRFDESDAMVVFDDVFVPADRVFAAGSVKVVNTQFWGTAAHAIGNLQSIIRLTSKLRFLVGIASKVAKANGREVNDGIRHQLADIASIATVSQSLAESAHAFAKLDDHGVYKPAGQFLYAAMGMQSDVYPRAVRLLGELAGGGVIQVPSSAADFDSADERASLDVVMGSAQLPARERVRLFKLAWDMVGSEFAGRHVQYERFYSGNTSVVKGYAYRSYPFAVAEALVDDFLASYGHQPELP